MSTYHKTIRVSQEDLDELNHVNNVRYLEWIQEISKEHWLSKVDQKTKEELIWVVRNHNITYYESALLGDTIELTTEVVSWKGPISVRQVTMKNLSVDKAGNKTDKTIVMATTEWCALHAKTMRPTRVPAAIQHLFITST